MYVKRKLKAFSMVELMMLLLVSSLIIAATVPLVTKRHLRMPSSVSHGAYMCYYKDGVLRETRYSGKTNMRKVFDRAAMGNCVFDPPTKATYFQISAIGGGGGGGDAGYNGGNPTEKQDTHTSLLPLGVTEDQANKYGLRDKNPAAADPYADAKAAVGTIWAFAKSLGSGAGGSVGYMVNDGDYDSDNCLSYETYCSKSASDYSGAKKYHCRRKIETETEEGTGTSSNIIKDFFAKLKIVNKIAVRVKGVITGAATTTTYEDCGSWMEYYQNHHKKWQEKVGSHQEPYTCCPGGTETYEKTPAGCEMVHVSKTCYKTVSLGGGGGESGAAQGSSSANISVPYDCSYDEKQCHEAVYGTRCRGGYQTCYKTVDDYETRTSSWTTNESTSKPSCYGDANVECYEVGISDSEAPCLEYSQRCAEYEQYRDRFTHTVASGAAGGSGAICSTNGVTHKLLNITFNTDAIASGTISAGESFDLTGGGLPCQIAAKGSNGFAVCQSGSLNGDSGCGSLENASYSQATISDNGTNHITRAYSSWRGGGGASRILTGPYDTPPKGEMYWNAEGPTPTPAADGACASSYESGGLGDCGSSDMTGYCLRRKKPGGGTEDVPNGDYAYKRLFDVNFLTKGNPGYAGQFHTVIVRSLDSVDRTIHIGRGGSPATLNLGGNGADGSATYMGASIDDAIIKADGGKGGEGYQYAVFPTQLPRFDADIWKAEKLCYKMINGKTLTAAETSQMNSSMAAAGMSSCPTELKDYKFIEDTGAERGSKPKTISFGGMFNFLQMSFNADKVLESLLMQAGKGGTGGGVTHNCWAGQDRIWLNETFLNGPSVTRAFINGQTYQGKTCFTDYENHVAGPGHDGALIIRW